MDCQRTGKAVREKISFRALKNILEDAGPVVQSLYAEEITAIMALHRSSATAGQIPPDEVLKAAANEIRELLAKAK